MGTKFMRWGKAVESLSDLPVGGNNDGDARWVLNPSGPGSSPKLYFWDNELPGPNKWSEFVSGGGLTGWTPTAIRELVAAALTDPADVTVTGTAAADLQTAITAAADGDILEVLTNAIYDPITLPASKSLVIRAAKGYGPRLSGTNCVKVENGAEDHIISGFTFSAYTTGDTNAMGAAITFKDQGSKCSRLIFHNLHFEEVTAGSAVLMSYHRTVGGDNYANPPQPSELSDKIAFVDCHFWKANKDGTEGAALLIRAFDQPVIIGCSVDGGALGGSGCRGYQFHNCTNIWVERSKAQETTVNGEGIKIDSIGTPVAVRNTGVIFDNDLFKCVEGIDCDDDCDVLVLGNRCVECTDEGISIDGGAAFGRVLAVGNSCTRCGIGILAEAGSVCELSNNACWNNGTNYSILNGYALPGSNVETPRQAAIPRYEDARIRLTAEGGYAILLTNSTVATIAKGSVVKPDSANDDSIVLTAASDPDPIGVVYADIPAGKSGWVVVAGRCEVLIDNAGGCVREDWLSVSTVTAGQATASVVPAPPSQDSHFREVGHTLRARGSAGLVFAVIHFN